MPPDVNRRSYRSEVRAAQAATTRTSILAAARRLFPDRGYLATTMADLAAEAGVAVDTVYAAVGPKPVVFRLLIEAAISGTDEAVVPDERLYVQQITRAPTANEKLAIYSRAVTDILQRLAPLYVVLREAAASDEHLAQLWDEIAKRRAANMRRFADDICATGETRAGLEAAGMADVIWATSSSEFWTLLVVERGWAPEQFEQWLVTTWSRLFLRAGD